MILGRVSILNVLILTKLIESVLDKGLHAARKLAGALRSQQGHNSQHCVEGNRRCCRPAGKKEIMCRTLAIIFAKHSCSNSGRVS